MEDNSQQSGDAPYTKNQLLQKPKKQTLKNRTEKRHSNNRTGISTKDIVESKTLGIMPFFGRLGKTIATENTRSLRG